MLVGVPIEIKADERRVALIPSSVVELVRHGHEVVVEAGWAAAADLTPELRTALESLAEDGATQRLRHDAHHVLAGRRPKG